MERSQRRRHTITLTFDMSSPTEPHSKTDVKTDDDKTDDKTADDKPVAPESSKTADKDEAVPKRDSWASLGRAKTLSAKDDDAQSAGDASSDDDFD